MHDSAMGVTIVSRAGFLTSAIESGPGFLTLRLCSHHPLREGNDLLVRVKGKNRDQQPEEKSQVLKGTLKTSVIPEEMNLHHQEMNLEKRTDERSEGSETREEQ